MRELKFRVWIHDWGGGRMEYDGFAVNESGKVLFLDEEVYTVGRRANQDRIVMQYTGLKDRNGKEIYESDILLVKYDDWSKDKIYPNTRCIVKWNAEKVQFDIEDRGNGSWEVIGNIYQNPELIK